MKYLFPAILFALVSLSPENSWAEKKYRVVVFGDSLVAGYQLQKDDAFSTKLERRIRAAGYEQIEVIDASREDNSSAAATSQTEFVARQLPDVVLIALGFNDAKRGVVTSAIGYNITTILAELKRTNAYIILLGNTGYPGRPDTYNRDLINYYYTTANTSKVPLYPDLLAGIQNNPALTMADGLHPNAAGVERMVESIFPMVDVGLRWRYDVYQQEQEHRKLTDPEQGLGITAPPAP